MTPAEVARALAARSWWEWRVRMAVRPVLADGTVEDVIGTVDAVGDHLVTVEWPDVGARAHAKRGHLLPDLTDAATAGVLLEMLPRGWTLHDHEFEAQGKPRGGP